MPKQIKFFATLLLSQDYVGALTGMQEAINQFLSCPVDLIDLKVTTIPVGGGGVLVVSVIYRDQMEAVPSPIVSARGPK